MVEAAFKKDRWKTSETRIKNENLKS